MQCSSSSSSYLGHLPNGHDAVQRFLQSLIILLLCSSVEPNIHGGQWEREQHTDIYNHLYTIVTVYKSFLSIWCNFEQPSVFNAVGLFDKLKCVCLGFVSRLYSSSEDADLWVEGQSFGVIGVNDWRVGLEDDALTGRLESSSAHRHQ